MSDSDFMREAIALARMAWGLTNPNPMVGAVIVSNGEIIGRGLHRRAGEPHAEINALNDVARHGRDTRGAELFVTLEPCSTFGRTPPCTDAIIRAGIRRVVVGAIDPNPLHAGRGVALLRKAGIEVTTGIENAECCRLNECFFKWITTHKPFVLLKMAMTLDGKIATASGDSRWVTGTEARSRVQQLRRMADAVMVGANTAKTDHPRLTVRDPEDWERQPLRLIASTSMSDGELAAIFPDGRFERVAPDTPESWQKLLADLGQRGVMALLIEGGGELAGSALAAGAVDKVEFHVAPKLLGGRGSIPVLGGSDPELMREAQNLYRVEVEHYGDTIAVSGYLREHL